MGRFQTRSQTKPLPSALVIGSDAEALLSKDDRASVAGRRTLPQPRAFAPSQEDVLNTLEAFTDDTIEDYELKHEEPSKPAITSVPNWLYTERGLCGATKAASLWWMNLVCMISHLGLLTTTVYFSVRDNGSLATPSLTVYLTDLDWDQGSGANALIPTFEKTSGISLPALVIAFFALSALAHLMVVVFNRRQAFATGFCVDEFNANSAIITQWTGWYFQWMHTCRNPLRCAPLSIEPAHSSCLHEPYAVPPILAFHRWVEYSFSAAIMALVFSVAGGVSHLYMLFMIFALIWCTMFFGHYAEVVCPPKDLGNDVRPKYWLKNDTNPHLLWIPGFSARFHRLIPHMLGYVP